MRGPVVTATALATGAGAVLGTVLGVVGNAWSPRDDVDGRPPSRSSARGSYHTHTIYTCACAYAYAYAYTYTYICKAAVKVQCQRLIPYTYHIHMRMRIHIHIVPEAHTAHTMPILCRGMHVCTVCMCEAAVKVHSSLPEAHTAQRILCPYYAEAPTHDSASAIPAVIIRACIVVAQVQSFARRRQAEQEARARTAAVRTLQARETERHACRRRGEGSRASGGEQLGFGASSARFITESDAALPALSAEEEAAIAKVQAIQRGRIGRRQAADRRARRQAVEAAERHEWEAQQQAAGRKAAAEHDAAAAHAEALRPEAMRTAGLVRGCQAHMMQACILTFAAHAFIATLELN